MPWIKFIDVMEANGQLKEIYEELFKKRGKIANIMKIHSLNPHTMKDHLNLYVNLMFGKSNLSREERELIGVVVSTMNGCEYCITHHANALNRYWKDNTRIRELKQDFRSVKLSDRIHGMIEYAVKLTKTPNMIKSSDIEKLRRCGFNDEDVLNINLITSYFNFVNRIALGLGVEFTSEEAQGYKV